MLPGNSEAVADLNDPERFGIFCRRILQEFGLPEPHAGKNDEWQIQALAVLLCTDTIKKSPVDPGQDTSLIIGNDLQREKALGLLNEWMSGSITSPRLRSWQSKQRRGPRCVSGLPALN